MLNTVYMNYLYASLISMDEDKKGETDSTRNCIS